MLKYRYHFIILGFAFFKVIPFCFSYQRFFYIKKLFVYYTYERDILTLILPPFQNCEIYQGVIGDTPPLLKSVGGDERVGSCKFFFTSVRIP